MSLETAKLLTKTHHLATTKYAMLTTTPFLTAPLWTIFSSTPIRPLQCLGVRVIPSSACISWRLRPGPIMYVYIDIIVANLVLCVYPDVCVQTYLCAYNQMPVYVSRSARISWWLYIPRYERIIFCVQNTYVLPYVHILMSHTSPCAYTLMSVYTPRYVLISWWMHAYLVVCVYLDVYIHTSLCEYTLMPAYIPRCVPISWCLCTYLVKCVNFDVCTHASLWACILMSAYVPRYLCIFWYLHA